MVTIQQGLKADGIAVSMVKLCRNKNTVQRIFQIKGWQVVKRAIGSRPRVEAKTSAAASAALEQALIARVTARSAVTLPNRSISLSPALENHQRIRA